MCKTNYDLDPAHYVSIPSFAWDACLRLTGIELELLQDPEDYQFFEQGMRGGIAVISGEGALVDGTVLANLKLEGAGVDRVRIGTSRTGGGDIEGTGAAGRVGAPDPETGQKTSCDSTGAEAIDSSASRTA